MDKRQKKNLIRIIAAAVMTGILIPLNVRGIAGLLLYMTLTLLLDTTF